MNHPNPQTGAMIGVGIAIGTGLGVALGLVLDNLALGISIGAGMGVAIGAALDQRNRTSLAEQRNSGRWLMPVLAAGIGALVFAAALLFLLLVRGA